MRNPIALLLAVGLLLAVNLGVAKSAHDAGASALLVALASTGGAGAVLLAAAIANGRPLAPTPGRLLFYMVAGGISYALPNLLVFAAAGRIGPGFAAMLHTVVPSLTYLVAIGWGIDRLAPRRALGLGLGMIGAATLVVARLGFSTDAESAALLVALIAPVSIALGNVLRSRFWPAGALPLDIAPGLLLAAAAQLGLVLLAKPEAAPPLPPGMEVDLLAAQAVVSAAYYALYFRLQHMAGPVYLSQIGYVATGFALPFSVLLLGERVSLPMLAGLGLVVVGIVLVRPSSQMRKPGPAKSATDLARHPSKELA